MFVDDIARMSAFPTAATLLAHYEYAAIVPLSLIAQPFVAMAGGLLARLGVLDVWALYLCLVVTAVSGDVGWYWVGRKFGAGFARRFGRYFDITDENVERVKQIFNKYDAPILLVSKVTNGLGFANVVLFTAGLSRVPFGRYVAFNIVGESVWSAMMVAVGYYFGELYLRVNDTLGRITLVTLCVLLVAAAVALLRRFYRSLANRI